MHTRKELHGNQSNQAATVVSRGRSRYFMYPAVGAFAVLVLCLTTAASAQSPFSQPPSRSGTFTIPIPSPPTRVETRPSPFGPPPPPASPLSPFRPFPVEVAPPRAGELPARPGMPLPLPLPELGREPSTGELLSKPEVAPPLSSALTAPVPRSEPIMLQAGLTVTLRVCQVLPADGFSPGERLLNGRAAIQPGDHFLAEVIDPYPPYPTLVGGTVTKVTDPGRFGRPGFVSLQMAQLVQTRQGQSGWIPWRMELADRRFNTKMRRALLTTLLGLEGAGTGASVGAQFSGGNMAFIGGGMGIGALVGLGYASFQRGTEANLEPGDTFEIVVGTTHYRPVSREWQTILYPAPDPSGRKVK